MPDSERESVRFATEPGLRHRMGFDTRVRTGPCQASAQNRKRPPAIFPLAVKSGLSPPNVETLVTHVPQEADTDFATVRH